MAERTIVGVDFSGGGKDTAVGNTWVTKGRFDGKTLIVVEGYPCPISRLKLQKLLLRLPLGSVAALDFPFGVATRLFHDFLLPGNYTMKDIWDRVSEMRFENKEGKKGETFDTLRANHPKLKRRFEEKYYDEESLSPQDELMRYMTYHGIRMLKGLHEKCPDRWHIPPLHSGRTREDKVMLLEVMPGAALNVRGFHEQYKSYKKNNGPNTLKHLNNRKHIIDELPNAFDIRLPDVGKHRDLFIFNDDALDSFIAAIVAALWANGTEFPLPENDNDPNLRNAARLEGCIYAPSKSPNKV